MKMDSEPLASQQPIMRESRGPTRNQHNPVLIHYGEIVSLDAQGRPQFEDLMFRRGELFFVAFDALWLDREDLRGKPLIDRKRALRRVVPRRSSSRLRYLDYIEERGCD